MADVHIRCLLCGTPFYLQVTMIKCKFIGFKFAVCVQSGAQVTMQDCSMDLPSSPAVDEKASMVCNCALSKCLLTASSKAQLLLAAASQ
jgi:hypothetical protein